MRKIKEVLRCHYEKGLSQGQISRICQITRSTVQEYLLRFQVSGYSWPLPETVQEDTLEKALFPGQGKRAEVPALDYEYLLTELRKPNVTKEVLWSEYKQENPSGYQYSYFCDLLKRYQQTLNYSMRQDHKAGEKGFVDFGEGPKILDPTTGAYLPTKIFVFVWGASQYTFVRATLGEDLASWIDVNVRALEYFGYCPKIQVPDNLKSAVTKACKYEPELNPTYADFARHYGTAIIPARPYRPKDKSLAENGVKLAKRWLLARLRNRLFNSLSELNEAITELLEQFNNRPFRKLKTSRTALFEALDKPHALTLPAQAYEFAEWKKVKVNVNYHVCFDQHDYSVPYTLIGQELEVRATKRLIEIIRKGQRIYTHTRSYVPHRYTTIPEHMPPAHRKYLEWTPERIMTWAAEYGPAVQELVQKIMGQRYHPQQAFKSCLGIIRLEKRYNAQRLNAACQRALAYRVYSYRGVCNILEKNLEQAESGQESTPATVIHENIRGAGYYDTSADHQLALLSLN